MAAPGDRAQRAAEQVLDHEHLRRTAELQRTPLHRFTRAQVNDVRRGASAGLQEEGKGNEPQAGDRRVSANVVHGGRMGCNSEADVRAGGRSARRNGATCPEAPIGRIFLRDGGDNCVTGAGMLVSGARSTLGCAHR